MRQCNWAALQPCLMSNVNDSRRVHRHIWALLSVTRFSMLSGTTALVVEDEYIIALEVQRILEGADASAIIAHPSVAGTVIPEGGSVFDLAIIAVPPRSTAMASLCKLFRERGVAVVVLTSGGEDDDGYEAVAGFKVVGKPFADHELLAAATAALKDRNSA